jgi:hypothetical protein
MKRCNKMSKILFKKADLRSLWEDGLVLMNATLTTKMLSETSKRDMHG